MTAHRRLERCSESCSAPPPTPLHSPLELAKNEHRQCLKGRSLQIRMADERQRQQSNDDAKWHEGGGDGAETKATEAKTVQTQVTRACCFNIHRLPATTTCVIMPQVPKARSLPPNTACGATITNRRRSSVIPMYRVHLQALTHPQCRADTSKLVFRCRPMRIIR